MQRFSIRNIELLTGIKAHTLRIWEQRYAFFKAERKQSNQRIYSNEDLKKLLCISFLYHNGWKVSKIAALPEEQIALEVQQTTLGASNYPTYVQLLLEAAVTFDERALLQTLKRLIDTIGFEKTITEICYPYLQRLGLLWNTGNVIPAQEHFSSYLIQKTLITETEKLPLALGNQPEIVLFCPENEFHELPLLFLNHQFRKHGWRVLYLGQNTGIATLKEAAQIPAIRYLYLHLITNFTGFYIDEYLETLQKAFPDKIIFASGKAIEQSQRNLVRVHLLKKDQEIHQMISSQGKSHQVG